MGELERTNRVKALSVGKFIVTRTGLVLDGDPSWQEWEVFMSGIEGVHQAVKWVIGDALEKIETQYGDEGAQLTNAFPDFELSTLMNYRWVSGQVKYTTRVENLSWAHHRAVAKFDTEQQEYYLSESIKNGWTTRDLYRELRENNPDDGLCICPICGDEHKLST